MKPSVKRDILGDKTSWIEKIGPHYEAFVAYGDLRTAETLPANLKLKPTSVLFMLLSLALVALFIYFVVRLKPDLSNTELRRNYFKWTLACLVGLAILLYLLYHIFRKFYKGLGSSLYLTLHGFKQGRDEGQWKDIRGIYVYHRPGRTGTMQYLILKTKKGKKIFLNLSYYNIDPHSVPALISLYHTAAALRRHKN